MKGEKYNLNIFSTSLKETVKRYEVGIEELVKLLKDVLGESLAKDSKDEESARPS